MLKGMLQEIVVGLLVVVLVMLLLLQLQIVQKNVHGNSATATTASKCTGNSATATKLATARNIKLQGAVSGNTNFDGSGNVVINTIQDNILIIIGTIEMPEANSEVITGKIEIKYPNGLTKDNCMIISLMSHNTLHNDWWSTSYNSKYSDSMTKGSGDLVATLKPNNITVASNKVSTQEDRKDVTFKLILMKLPQLVKGVDYTLGDVNGDGKINNDDIQMVKNYNLHKTEK